jgi:hypothetical protein
MRAGATIEVMARREHSWFRRLLGLGTLAGILYALWRVADANRDGADLGWQTQPFPFPPQPRIERASCEPVGGACPASHPVKGKRASGIYHLPSGSSYDRTQPDRCYLDAAAAEADGLRAAKR